MVDLTTGAVVETVNVPASRSPLTIGDYPRWVYLSSTGNVFYVFNAHGLVSRFSRTASGGIQTHTAQARGANVSANEMLLTAHADALYVFIDRGPSDPRLAVLDVASFQQRGDLALPIPSRRTIPALAAVR